MTQPFQYDPSQQPPGPTPSPYDPSAQQPSGSPAAPFDAAQQPGTPGAQPGGEPGQPPMQFSPSNEQSVFGPGTPDFLPPPPPKKSKNGLFIVLGIVVLLLIGGGIGVAIWRPWAPASDSKDKADSSQSADDGKESGSDGKDSKDDDKKDTDEVSPKQVVDDAWHAKDWDEAKTFMCSDLVSELEKSGASKNFEPIGEDEEFSTTGESVEGDNATVTVETTVSADGEAKLGTIDVELIKEDSEWKVCKIGEPE